MREEIIREIIRLEEDSLYSEKAHFAIATLWGRLHYALGIPSAMLAAAAGVSALNERPEIAAGTAIASAVLTALMTFLDPEKVRADHHASGIRYSVLRGKLRRFRSIDLAASKPPPEARATVETFADEKAQIMQSSRHTGGLAYRLGKASILRQQHEHVVDATER